MKINFHIGDTHLFTHDLLNFPDNTGDKLTTHNALMNDQDRIAQYNFPQINTMSILPIRQQ
jgi:hypothetical protein